VLTSSQRILPVVPGAEAAARDKVVNLALHDI
jgi:hypothetical protein